MVAANRVRQHREMSQRRELHAPAALPAVIVEEGVSGVWIHLYLSRWLIRRQAPHVTVTYCGALRAPGALTVIVPLTRLVLMMVTDTCCPGSRFPLVGVSL